MIGHHQILSTYRAYNGPLFSEIWADWIGARFPRKLVAPFPNLEKQERQLPAFDEEYFEWVDLLQAIADAGTRFVMIELRAGWGRWSIQRGALAARQRGIDHIDLRCVEAEPQHAAWLRQCLELNELSDCGLRIVEAAFTYAPSPAPFLVGARQQNAFAYGWKTA